MSVASVLPYFRTRLKALGYKEWDGGFERDNIPKSILQDRFFLELGKGSATKFDQGDTEMRFPVKVMIFKPPGRDVNSIKDAAIAAGDAVLTACTSAANRLAAANGAGFKNVMIDSFEVEQLSETNDNGCIVTMEFTVLVSISNE